MILSCPTVFFFVFIVIFAIFIANVANLINNLSLSHESYNGQSNPHRWLEQSNVLRIDDSTEHLMWFVQISDIHISYFSDKERIAQFREFTTKTLSILKPDIVLASGDLTDARDDNYFGSRQYKFEWEVYRKAIDDSSILNKTIWMDIRGNHDNFNVPAPQSDANFFNQYAVQGKTNPRAYMKQIQKGSEKYTFIAVDACLEPKGPKRPFNFIGVLSKNDTNHLKELADQARKNGGNYTIWFGHYPTSCIITTDTGSYGLRRLIGSYDESFAYLCGHLHNFGGTVPRMFALQHDGFLELEIGDWKKFRWFRLGAIDHGLFSFVDTHHNDWPIVLITNPKNYLFNIPHRENPNLQIEFVHGVFLQNEAENSIFHIDPRINFYVNFKGSKFKGSFTMNYVKKITDDVYALTDSTHIRIIAFSTAPINNCSIRINAEAWQNCTKVNDNLFVVKWHPHLYSSGVHNLEVNIVDDDGKQRLLSQSFSLDGTRKEFDTMARITLMSDATSIFKFLFGFAVSFCVVPLVFFRVWHILTTAGWLSRPRATCPFFIGIVRRFWILSTINRIVFPIIIYCLYLVVGPWSIVDVVDGHTGYVFFHGIYVNDGYVPNALSCLYGFFQLMLCQLPMNIIFSTLINKRYCKYVGIHRKAKSSYLMRKLCHAPFFIIITVEILLAIVFGTDYGIVALLLSPFRAWSVVMNIILWFLAKNIPDECLRPAARVWSDRTRSYEIDSSHRDL